MFCFFMHALMNLEIAVLHILNIIHWFSDQITMQKLILLCLFLSCFEIQNVLGNELLEHFGIVPWDPQPRLPRPPVPIIEPCPIPPFQDEDCWDGNKCHWHWQCGKNGKCRDKKLIGDGSDWVGYVHLQKSKAHLIVWLWQLKNNLNFHTLMALYHCHFLS